MVGQTISHYKVLEKIGEGGMGEVYRATDTKLNRDVALKILPQQFASDSQRMGRFQREAEVLASLDHPNIGQIYGIEDAGQTKALVLQLIEGPTLADKIAQGPIPVEETLKIALQMAEGLEAAHEKGVIHRDLKPANIKITPEGQVKILDFGLAKLFEEESPITDISQSPTLTAAATQAGVILGTAAYMSPEQARGKSVDKRADIFAFGAVLYECLTGKRAFEGEDISDTLASILAREPDWNSLPADLNPKLGELLERCLTKDPKNRWHHVADVRVDLQRILNDPGGLSLRMAIPVQPLWQRALPWAVAAVMGLIALVLLFGPSGSSPPTKLIQIALPDGVFLPIDTEHPALDLSDDGSLLAFVGDQDGTRRLYLANVDGRQVRVLEGTEGAAAPFFHPTGNWIGFHTDDGLYRISTTSGVPAPIMGAFSYAVGRGSTWLEDDMIANVSSRSGGVQRLTDTGDGGFPDAIDWITRALNLYAFPDRVPGSGGFVLNDLSGSELDEAEVLWMSADTGNTRALFSGGTNPRYSPTGHLIYGRNGALYAQRFDVGTLTAFADTEHQLLASVITDSEGAAQFAVGGNRTLAYVDANTTTDPRYEMVWVDRSGAVVETIREEARRIRWLRLSIDGATVAGTVARNNNLDIFKFDLRRGVFDVLTTDLGEDFGPVWGSDGSLAFASEMDEDPESPGPELAWIPISGGGPQVLKQVPGESTFDFPTSWSPDSRTLAIKAERGGAGLIAMLDMDTRELTPFVDTPARESSAVFSPDGKWIAYLSDHRETFEIYVKPFPASDTGHSDATRLSTNGGVEPMWSRDGEELFYWEGHQFMVVTFGDGYGDPNPALQVFEGHFERSPAGFGAYTANYDVSLDGERFLMIRNANPITPRVINVIQNWPEMLGVPVQ